MDDEEAREVEYEIRSALAVAGLGWVIEQVDGSIADGIVEVVDKPMERETVGKVEALSRGTLNRWRSERTRPYTPHERVYLILEATRRAVVETAELEARVTRSLAEYAAAEDVAFVSAPDETRSGFVLQREPREQETTDLGRVLQELVAETAR